MAALAEMVMAVTPGGWSSITVGGLHVVQGSLLFLLILFPEDWRDRYVPPCLDFFFLLVSCVCTHVLAYLIKQMLSESDSDVHYLRTPWPLEPKASECNAQDLYRHIICIFVCVHMSMYVCMSQHMDIRGQLKEDSSPHSLRRFWALNSGELGLAASGCYPDPLVSPKTSEK